MGEEVSAEVQHAIDVAIEASAREAGQFMKQAPDIVQPIIDNILALKDAPAERTAADAVRNAGFPRRSAPLDRVGVAPAPPPPAGPPMIGRSFIQGPVKAAPITDAAGNIKPALRDGSDPRNLRRARDEF